MNLPAKIIGVLLFGLIIVSLILLTSCGPRPQYKTSLGKKKLKYYNSIQYDQTQPKEFKSFNKAKKR